MGGSFSQKTNLETIKDSAYIDDFDSTKFDSVFNDGTISGSSAHHHNDLYISSSVTYNDMFLNEFGFTPNLFLEIGDSGGNTGSDIIINASVDNSVSVNINDTLYTNESQVAYSIFGSGLTVDKFYDVYVTNDGSNFIIDLNCVVLSGDTPYQSTNPDPNFYTRVGSAFITSDIAGTDLAIYCADTENSKRGYRCYPEKVNDASRTLIPVFKPSNVSMNLYAPSGIDDFVSLEYVISPYTFILYSDPDLTNADSDSISFYIDTPGLYDVNTEINAGSIDYSLITNINPLVINSYII